MGDIVKHRQYNNNDKRYIFTDGFTTKRAVKLCFLPPSSSLSSGEGEGGGGGGEGKNGRGSGNNNNNANNATATTLSCFHPSSSTHTAPFIPVEFTSSVVAHRPHSSSGARFFGNQHTTVNVPCPKPVFRVYMESCGGSRSGLTLVSECYEGPRTAWELAIQRTPEILKVDSRLNCHTLDCLTHP